MSLDSQIAHHWCQELADNLTDFRKKGRLKPESKLKFVSKQYASLFALVKVMRGDAVMKGVPTRMFAGSQSDSLVDE